MIHAEDMAILEENKDLGIYRLKISGPVNDAVAFARSQPIVKNARPNHVLAEVDDEMITLLDMESFIAQVNPFLRQIYTKKEALETLLHTIVEYKLFAKAAGEKNLAEAPDVKRKIEAAKEKALAQVYQQKITKSILVSEKEIKDYYDTHLKEFQIPEEILVQQILVATQKEAEVISGMIKDGGKFDRIARERSKMVASQWGGNPVWIGRGRIDPSGEEAAFALAKGEVSGIVKTGSGYLIFKLVDRRGPGPRALSEVRDKIEQTLRNKKHRQKTEEERKQLEKRYKTTLHTASLTEVKVRATGKRDQGELLRNLKEMIEKPY
jgi:peptidyl-prolyl cis-trans isomerase C